MTTVALDAFPQYSTNGGLPLAGGKVFSYQAGTLIPLATYTDRGGLTANANPVVLDSAGRADIWLSVNVAYKLILEDSAGDVIDSVDDYYAGADPAQLTAAGIVPATGGIYTGLVEFEGGVEFNGDAAENLHTLDTLGVASVQNANLWTNSDAAIAQRVLGSTADAAYGFDRIVNVCDTGSTTLSQLAQPADGIPYAMRITQPDAGAKRFGFLQIVEAKDCLAYRGKNLVFALKVRCSASTTIRCALVAWTGAVDAPTRDVVNNWASTTYTAGNFFVANTSTIAVSAQAVTAATWTDMVVSSTSPGGVVAPSTMNNLYMVVWTDTTQAQNVTLDASVFRCGQGTVAPLWTPPNAQVELAKCRRFLPAFTSLTTNHQVAVGQNNSTTTALVFVPFDVVTRTIVTSISTTGTFAITNAAGAVTGATAVAISVGGTTGTLLLVTIGAPNQVAGNATTMQATSIGANIIFIGAEL